MVHSPRLSRWRFRYIVRSLFLLPVICAAGCLWVIWPQRTARAFLAALSEERTEEAVGMIRESESRPYHSLRTQLRLDAQLQIVLDIWRRGATEPRPRNFWISCKG